MSKTEPSIRDRAVEMYLSGMGSKVIAKDLGVSKDSVLGWVRADGHRVRSDNRLAAEIRELAVEMYAAGMASEVIGAELGISGTTVTKYARKAGVRIRDRKGRRIDHEEHALVGGRWVNTRGIQRWVPDPKPRPVAELLACSCGATLAAPCDHQTRVVSRRCPCGNRPPEGRDYCTTECEREVAA